MLRYDETLLGIREDIFKLIQRLDEMEAILKTHTEELRKQRELINRLKDN